MPDKPVAKPTSTPKSPEALTAYCMKCHAKTEIKDPKAITMKTGKPATEGTCPKCPTRVFRIGKAK